MFLEMNEDHYCRGCERKGSYIPKKRFFLALCAILGLFLAALLFTPLRDCRNLRIFFSFAGDIAVSCAYAEEQGDRSPYGGSRQGEYGEKKAVPTAAEARKTLKEYFSKRDVTIGEIREKEFYFEAEIKDKQDKVIDKVIVDKRTGRIRSIY